MRKLLLAIALIAISFGAFGQQKLVDKQTFSNKFLDAESNEYLARKDFIAKHGTDAYYTLLNDAYKKGEIDADELNFCLTDKEYKVKEKIIFDNRPTELPTNNLVTKYKQGVSHFKLNDGKIEFQKIYEYQGDKETIKNEILSLAIFSEILNVTDTRIVGRIKQARTLWKELGYKAMSSPLLVTRIKIDGHVTIDIKDNFYRITLRDIMIDDRGENDRGGLNGHESAEFYFLTKKRELTSYFKEYCHVYEYTLDKLFELKPLDENW